MRLSEGAVHCRPDRPPQAGQLRAASAVPIGSTTVHGPHPGHRYWYRAITSTPPETGQSSPDVAGRIEPNDPLCARFDCPIGLNLVGQM